LKRILIAAGIGATALVGCGGGGGADAPAGAAPMVSITTTNKGTVARATIDGGQAIGGSQPFAATGRATAQSVSSPQGASRVGALQSVVRRGLVAAFVPRPSATIASAMRAAATSASTEPCSVSGSITTALSDADNSQSLSAGDSLNLTFNQCKDSADDVVNGAMSFTVGSVASAVEGNVKFSGSLAFVQVSSTSGTRSANIQGSVGVAAAITSTAFQMALTVGGDALTVTSSASGYLDTIVYDPGMQLAVAETDGAVTQTEVTLNGSFTASSIGGRVQVTTMQPLRQLGTDIYPSSGQVVVTGSASTHLRVTALNATQVQLELDANGDGTYEGSGVFAWGTLATI